MLVKFTVSNYKSFRNVASLNMTTGKRLKDLQKNIVQL